VRLTIFPARVAQLFFFLSLIGNHATPKVIALLWPLPPKTPPQRLHRRKNNQTLMFQVKRMMRTVACSMPIFCRIARESVVDLEGGKEQQVRQTQALSIVRCVQQYPVKWFTTIPCTIPCEQQYPVLSWHCVPPPSQQFCSKCREVYSRWCWWTIHVLWVLAAEANMAEVCHRARALAFHVCKVSCEPKLT
jgi:hypothetical protein